MKANQFLLKPFPRSSQEKLPSWGQHQNRAIFSDIAAAGGKPEDSTIKELKAYRDELRASDTGSKFISEGKMRSYFGAKLTVCTVSIGILLIAPALAAKRTSPASCYSVTPAQAGVPAILLDSCSGRTWQLIARHRAGTADRQRSNIRYVWRAIIRSERETARSEPPAAATQPASTANNPPKCFEFAGRKYCE